MSDATRRAISSPLRSASQVIPSTPEMVESTSRTTVAKARLSISKTLIGDFTPARYNVRDQHERRTKFVFLSYKLDE
jgi:hypothetical protein